MKIIPVILAGGFGTRLWPISRQSLPKQFSNFFGEKTLFQNTILRFIDSTKFAPPIIIGNHEHRFLIAQQLQDINIKAQAIILEPTSKNTAGSIIAVSHYIHQNFDKDSIALICPADHYIDDSSQFVSQIIHGIQIANNEHILTFGIKPTNPETGYGYILKSAIIDEKNNIYKVDKFIEKPNIKDAESFISNNKYYWNSGIYLFNVNYFLNSAQSIAVNIYENCLLAVKNSTKDLDFIRLDEAFYNKCPNISIDYAIMETAKNMAIMSLNIKWSDVGSWRAIQQLSPQDLDNNFKFGRVINLNTKNCYIRSDSLAIATIGVENLIIIATKDAVLVANSHNSNEMRSLFSLLQNQYPEICRDYHKSLRPWGSFGDRFRK